MLFYFRFLPEDEIMQNLQEKIKKMLGLDIRKFEDAVTLQVILILKRLEQKRKRRTNKLTRLQSI